VSSVLKTQYEAERPSILKEVKLRKYQTTTSVCVFYEEPAWGFHYQGLGN
jgi:hypothetical protein